MGHLIGGLIAALARELSQRHDIKELLEKMERDHQTLEDIGISFEEFAAAQWESHRRVGSLGLYLQKLQSGNAPRAQDHATEDGAAASLDPRRIDGGKQVTNHVGL